MDTNSTRNRAESPVRIGEFEICPDRLVIRRGGVESAIRQQTLRVLLFLIEHRDRVVSRDELHQAIWGDVAVTPDALVQCIVEIRKLLDDRAREPRFVRTVKTIGYAYVGPVPQALEEVTAPAVPVPVTSATWKRYLPFIGAAAAILIAVMALTRLGPRMPQWSNTPGQKHLVVLPFTNTSADQSLSWLQDGLPNMLMTGLARSAGISAVAMPEAGEGRAIARAAHADAVLSGSFSAVGDALRVDVRIESIDGTTIATDALVAPRRDAVLSEVDHLSERLIAAVGGTAPRTAALSQVGDVMTNDLDAYQAYVTGVQRARALEPTEAIEYFQRAVARDPEFAMAHARIGATYAVTLGFAEQGRPYLQKAFQMSSRLRERDRLWILAWYSLAKLDYDAAIPPLQTLVANRADDVEAYAILANILIGQEHWDQALDVIHRGLSITPDATELLNHASAVSALLGKQDEAMATARRYVALAPREANAYDSLGLRLLHFGRYDEAIAAFDEATRVNPQFRIAYAHAGNGYFAQGRLRDATASYERFLREAANHGDRARAYNSFAWIAYKAGDPGRARELAERAFAFSQVSTFPLNWFALERGDLMAYRRVTSQSTERTVSNRGAPFPPIQQHYLAALDLMASDRIDEAIAELREATRHPSAEWALTTFEDCLGEALVRFGRYGDARVEYRRLAAEQPWVARYHYQLARIAEHDGDAALASREFQQFLQLWPKADPDLPEVKTARAYVTTLARR